MKKKITTIILLMIACAVQAVDSVSIQRNNQERKLLTKLNGMESSDTLRLAIYKDLIYVFQNTDKELTYIEKLIEEAELNNNDKYKCRGYLYRMHYAYNRYDAEEVNLWMNKLEPVATKAELYDFLFLGKRCVIDMLMMNGEYEREEKEANEMLRTAIKVKNDLGIILANQCLSNVYRMTYRNRDAVTVLKEAYKIADRINDPLMFEINNSLITVYGALEDNPNQLTWIKTMDTSLQKHIKKDPELAVKYRGWLLMTAISYVKYYTASKDYDSAKTYLSQMDKYRMRGYGTYEMNYYSARLNYFEESGQLEGAVENADSILDIFKDLELITYIRTSFIKADLLAQLGKVDEAISVYQQTFAVSDSANVDLVNKQTEQLKQYYDSDTLTLEKERNRSNLQVLLLALSIVVIVILVVFAIHTYRTQRKLRQSEEDMRQMADAMELANVAKDNFLATINSSINVPLNAVVMGALKLASDEVTDIESRQVISATLNKTSVELMELVNSILNLSKLEAGMMKFREEEVEIYPFVMGILTMARSNGLTVKSDLLESTNTVKILFDIARLQELFGYLLIPAVTSGELSLKMWVAEDTRSLSISIEGSVLSAYELQKQPQKIAITNEVNRLLVTKFGGRYELNVDITPSFICFSLPML